MTQSITDSLIRFLSSSEEHLSHLRVMALSYKQTSISDAAAKLLFSDSMQVYLKEDEANEYDFNSPLCQQMLEAAFDEVDWRQVTNWIFEEIDDEDASPNHD